jgi:type II secretory pathway component PulF
MEFLHWLGSLSAWSLGTLILIGVPLAGLFAVSGPILGYPFLLVAIALMPMLTAASRSVRRRRATSVLGYLQQAIRLNLPLNRFLAAASHSEKGRLSREIVELRHELESGTPLAVALAMSVPEMSERNIALIDYAEQMGRLPETLDRLVREQVGESRKVRENRMIVTWYPPILMIMGGAVVFMIDLFVLPKFTSLFKENHLPLPAPTRWLIEASDWLVLLVPIVAAIVVVMCALRFREAVKMSRPTWLFQGLKDRILWMLPLSRGPIRDRAMADLCTALADSVELGYPLDQALLRAQQLELNLVVKRRMERWRQGLVAGRSPGEAAREANMPQLLAGMLTTASTAANTNEALRFLARYYADRFVLGRELLRGMAVPAITLLMGILVGAVALALIVPLQQLIEAYAHGRPR